MSGDGRSVRRTCRTCGGDKASAAYSGPHETICKRCQGLPVGRRARNFGATLSERPVAPAPAPAPAPLPAVREPDGARVVGVAVAPSASDGRGQVREPVLLPELKAALLARVRAHVEPELPRLAAEALRAYLAGDEGRAVVDAAVVAALREALARAAEELVAPPGTLRAVS